MKPGIHPDYHPVVFRDASTGKEFLTRSTITASATVEWSDGNVYPLVVVDITADPHPFWTGRGRVLDTQGRVEKFRRRYGDRRRAGVPADGRPERKMSRSNTRHRRSQWKATAPDLVPITVRGEQYLVPRRLMAAGRRGLYVPK